MWGLPKPAGHPTAGALLPHLSTLTDLIGGLNFYGTVPKVALAGRYPAHCPVELGLSSPLRKEGRDCLGFSYQREDYTTYGV